MLPVLPFSQHCFWQEQGALSVGKARHCLSCLPRRARNEKWEEEMEKEETLACERAHGDRHTPPLNSSWRKQHSLSAVYHRERIHSNVQAGTVCYQLCLDTFSWLPECGDSVFHAGSLCYNKEKINQVWSLLVLCISKCTCPTRFISIMFTLSNLQIETLGSGVSNIIWLYLNVLICNTTLTLSSLCLFSWWLSLPAFPGAFSLPNY